MTKTYTVKAGDTIFSITFQEGFRSWETIWNHPQNQALRTKRSDPNNLFIGDQIFIPDKTPKSVQIKAFTSDTDSKQKYTFKAKSVKAQFSLRLEDEDDDPYIEKAYLLVVNTPEKQEKIEGKTDVKGFLKAAIAPNARSLNLTLWTGNNREVDKVEWTFQLGATPPPSLSTEGETEEAEEMEETNN